MEHENDQLYDEREPTGINYQASTNGNPNLGLPPSNPFANPVTPPPWQEQSSERSSPINRPMSQDTTANQSVDKEHLIPSGIQQTLSNLSTERSTKQYADVHTILGSLQTDTSASATENQNQQELLSTTEASPNAQSLQSPLFQQHLRLRSLLVNPQDHFTQGSSGDGVAAIQQALMQLYPDAAIGEYGVYGEQTVALVERFQADEGLGSDGDFGRNTLLALDQYSFSRTVIGEEGERSVQRQYEVSEEVNRPAKISATADDIGIAQGQESQQHDDRGDDTGIYHNQEVSGVRVYSEPIRSSKLKFTLLYNTDVTLVGEYTQESSWSLIQTADGREGWMNSDYVTMGNALAEPLMGQLELSMVGDEQANLGDVVNANYSSDFIEENDARLIIHAIALMNEGRAAIYYDDEAHSLSWWENLLLNATEEEARSIYQTIGVRADLNILLPSEALILQMREAGLVSSGSITDNFQGVKDFLYMYGGYTIGVLEGLWEGLVGTLRAIPDLLQMIWDVIKAAFQGTLVSQLSDILSGIWEFIKNLPQNAGAWWQEFLQKSPFEQGKTIGRGVGMIAFEVILAIFTGGVANAIRATAFGARIAATSTRITQAVGRFGDDLARVSERMLNDMGDVLLPQQMVTPDGRVLNVRRNDLLDHERPQTMRMDGDRDGGGRNPRNVSELRANWNNWSEKDIEDYYELTRNGNRDLSSNSPDHKAQRWQDYKNDSNKAGWGYDRWSRQYHINMSNPRRTLREQYYKDMLQDGVTPDRIKTPFTYRHLDIQVGDTKKMYEVKTGKEYYTRESSNARLPNEERIKKDAWLVDNGYDVTWILEKGASKPLLKALDDAGIEYHIGIPKKLN